jgi:hypothetical protein
MQNQPEIASSDNKPLEALKLEATDHINLKTIDAYILFLTTRKS